MLFVLQPEIKIILNILAGLFSVTSDIPSSKLLSGSTLGKTAPTQVSSYIQDGGDMKKKHILINFHPNLQLYAKKRKLFTIQLFKYISLQYLAGSMR